MRLTLSKSRSKLFQPCPLQGDLTACFALGNVCFALGTKSYSTSQPQFESHTREGRLCHSGCQTYLHPAAHALGKYTFTYGLGIGIDKTIIRQSSISDLLPRQRQCSETAQKEFPVSSITLVWGWQWGWPGTSVLSSP